MARIPEAELERLKTDISLIRLIESRGYQLKKQGKDYAMCCPFHKDDTPSFIVSPAKNLYHCFGCGAAGSVVDWVMKLDGVSFRYAVELLRSQSTSIVVADTVNKPVKRNSSKKLPSSLAADSDHQTLLKQVIDFYHETLMSSPEALDYLASRGLNDPECIKHFKLGYCNRTLGYRLPEKNRKAGEAVRNKLQTLGILRESGHEHFNGSIVIPVIQREGDQCIITEVYGRKLLGKRLRKGTAQHLYLPGPHQGIFNREALQQTEVILCESLIDALTFWVHGFKQVTCSYGVNGFTDELLTVFKGGKTQRVLIAYDRDEAGNHAAEDVAKLLLAEGIECYRLLFPKNMDANSYALNMTPARKSLELVIRKAEWMGQGEKPAELQSDILPVKKEVNQDEVITDAKESYPLVAKAAEETTKPLPASPVPKIKTSTIEAEVKDEEIIVYLDNRRYRVRGLQKAMSYDSLKINILVNNDEGLHVDTFDLYHARYRQGFIKQAASELSEKEDVIKKDLAKLLLKLEQLQEEQIQAAQSPKETTIEVNAEEQQAALALLRDPHLLENILSDFHRAGVVGEETNKLVGYLAAVSRKLDNPLAVIIQSTSAAGKSSLMNAVLAMMPEEERIHYSAMTGQSLFYMGETNLKHKILAIAEEEGAEQASYALKLLQSEGELTIASTGKDSNGNLTTQEYRVEGPVMLFSTTTAIDIDEELMNRCVVLTVNESREQTQLIHQIQRRKRTLAGLKDKTEKNSILTLHRNAQRLLKPYHIVNPYADQLTFLDDKTRTRRDHEKYLSLIDTITLLHQYQRQKKQTTHNGEVVEYIEVDKQDIAIANQLAHDILGRTLDELPPQTRNLLSQLEQWVKVSCEKENIKTHDFHFSRRQVREATGWGNTQLKTHLARLVEMEYLTVHNPGHGKTYRYELHYAGEGKGGERFLMHLINVEKLHQDANWSGQNDERSGVGRPLVGAWSVPGRGKENEKKPVNKGRKSKNGKLNGKRSSLVDNSDASHRSHISPMTSDAECQQELI